ncbi:MAG: hypothetical protein E7473_05010 [Ruminococcaceae bacterium]|nr:hypothetical protein [Oscillospiraceae bacterium]
MSNKVTEVTYHTPDGGSAKGYIIDGRTYKDPYGQARVDVGSVVPTAGGTYILSESGGVKSPSSIGSDVRKAYEKSEENLAAARAATLQGIRAANQKAQDTIKDQRRDADIRYADANRAAYQAYVNASNPYGAAGEMQAKLGLSDSGYSETSKLRTANAYQEALSENSLVRDAYMRELDAAYRNAKYDGDIELANAIAEYEKLVYRHGIDAAENIAKQDKNAYDAYVEANNEAWRRKQDEKENARRAENDAWEREKYERESARQAEKDAWEREKYAEEVAREAKEKASEKDYEILKKAVTLANSGASDAAIANALGLTLSELYTMIERGV